MSFSSHVRFQEVHALVTHLLFQNEPQRAITITRKRIRHFVILPHHLYRELQSCYQPYRHHFPLVERQIGITAFRKEVLSFERACTMFGEPDQADMVFILRHNATVGVMFLYDRYEALLSFLRSQGVSGLDTFTCDERQPDQTERVLPMAAAIQRFSDFPTQFATEQVGLPIIVTKDRMPVLAIFPWAICQAIMQELASNGVPEMLQPLIEWWRIYHTGETSKETSSDQQFVSAAYTFAHPDGRTVTVHSLKSFLDEAYSALVYQLTCNVPEVRMQEEEQDERLTDALCDLLVPKPEEWKKLLAFVLWFPGFFFDTLEPDILPDNLLYAAHLVYTQICTYVGGVFANRWEDAVLAAKGLRYAQITTAPDVR